MIDNIDLKVSYKDDELLLKRLEDTYRRDINTYSGHIQNMGIYHNLDGVHIHGSLAKYYRGENITPLTLLQVKEAITMLEIETGIELETAIIKGVELGISIITKESPSEYLRLFGNRARFTRHEYSSLKGVGTITYSNSKGSFQFSGYDKTKEIIQKHKQIPIQFEGLNILRLEYKIVRRRGIKAKFHRDLTAYDLFNPVVYQKLQSFFLEAYQAIPKFGRQFYIDTSENITPKKWEEMLAEQYRQSFPDQYRNLLHSLRESGAISDKSIERIRATERKREREYSMVDRSPLIIELDEQVGRVMQSESIIVQDVTDLGCKFLERDYYS
jgi:hypothetical protein